MHRVRADDLRNPWQRHRKDALPLIDPAAVNTAVGAPAAHAVLCALDKVLVKTLRNQPVVGKRLELWSPVASASTLSARKKPIHVDRVKSQDVV